MRKGAIRQRELVSDFSNDFWNLGIFYENKIHRMVQAHAQLLIKYLSTKLLSFFAKICK